MKVWILDVLAGAIGTKVAVAPRHPLESGPFRGQGVLRATDTPPRGCFEGWLTGWATFRGARGHYGPL